MGANRQVSIFVNGQQAEATAKSVSAEYRKASNELANMVIGSDDYIKKLEEVKNLDGVLQQHRQSIKGIEQGYGLAKDGLDKIIGVAAGAFAVDHLISYGKELFGVAAQMDLMSKKAATVFGDALPKITEEAKKNAAAMGLTEAGYIAAAASIQDILVPMGFQRQKAAEITAQIQNLSGALSEWSGGQLSAQDVSTRLQHALTGERESLKELGIAISEEDIKQKLKTKGLEDATGKTLEQAKAMITLELIMAKSTDAQEAFAKGSGSMARQQAEASAKLKEIGEQLAVILLPVFNGLLSLVGPITGGLGSIVQSIGALTDPAKTLSKEFDEQTEKVGNLEKNIAPLLDRYDTLSTQSNLSKDEQAELAKTIDLISKTVPSAVTEFDKYGKALALNTDEARKFIETEKNRLQYVNREAIKANEDELNSLNVKHQAIERELQIKEKTLAVDISGHAITQKLSEDELAQRYQQLGAIAKQMDGVDAEIKRLKGEQSALPKSPEAAIDNGPDPISEKAQKKAEELAKKLQELLQKQSDFATDLLAKQGEDQVAVALRGVEKRYDEEIRKAIELEKQGVTKAKEVRIALEKLKIEEMNTVIEQETKKSFDEQLKKDLDRMKAKAQTELDEAKRTEQFLTDRDKNRETAQAEIDKFKADSDEKKANRELFDLDVQYKKLLDLSDEFFNNDNALRDAYEKKKKQIIDKGNLEELKKKTELSSKLEEAEGALNLARAKGLQDGAAALAGFFDQSSAMYKALFLFQKAAAIAEVVIQLQIEKAKNAAANAAIPIVGPALTLVQNQAANIRAAVSIGTIIATTIAGFVKPTQQKYTGSYLTTGAQDGRQYNANIIAPPSTGLLPNYPVAFQSNATGAPVLASERGAEYFVASEDLRKPYVANLVRMIDSVTHGSGGVQQYAGGGAVAPASSGGLDAAVLMQVANAINTLNALLARGIPAVVGDRAIVDISRRFDILNDASGGFLSK